jgi:hypothetical protein
VHQVAAPDDHQPTRGFTETADMQVVCPLGTTGRGSCASLIRKRSQVRVLDRPSRIRLEMGRFSAWGTGAIRPIPSAMEAIWKRDLQVGAWRGRSRWQKKPIPCSSICAIPSEPLIIRSRFCDGPDGRRGIGANPAGGGVGGARAPRGPLLPPFHRRQDEGTTELGVRPLLRPGEATTRDRRGRSFVARPSRRRALARIRLAPALPFRERAAAAEALPRWLCNALSGSAAAVAAPADYQQCSQPRSHSCVWAIAEAALCLLDRRFRASAERSCIGMEAILG